MSSPPILDVTSALPDEKALTEAVRILEDDGVIALPTDTLYGIGCSLANPRAIERIYQMRGIDGARRPLTFLLPDLGEIARWAKVTGTGYTIMEKIFPGPYCVELRASARVPNPYVAAERETIGVRVPDHIVCTRLMWLLGKPILTATAKARDGRLLSDAADIEREYGEQLDLILDGGTLTGSPSTVVSLVDDWVEVLREGRGPTSKIMGADAPRV